MTTITRNLPRFICDLGVSIIGKNCYASLIENLDISDVQCIRYSISKGLGVGIVVGGSIMKVPQVLLILNARSARGLSLMAYILETLSYAITLAYSFRNEFPFSTYGENFFLTIQNALVTLLIIYFPSILRRSQNTTAKLAVASLATISLGFILYILPKETLSLLQLGTLPLSLFSKLPQIRQNLRSNSTGQLSAFAVISQIAGCLARLFTTATEVGDLLVFAGFALALLLNCVLGAQLWLYWRKDEREEAGIALPRLTAEKEKTPLGPQMQNSPVDVLVPQRSPAVNHLGSQPSGTGRKWTRKVD
jgi:mannose-P-dolichol utilization defect protein 1